MKHISILVPEGDSSLSNLEATYKMFSMVNQALERNGKTPLFNVQLIGITRASQTSIGMFTVRPDMALHEVDKTDLIIIPAVHGNVERIMMLNKEFVPWIIQQYKNGAEVASLCIGAFILAMTGLLKGRNCATHWLAAEDFRKRFPEVHLVDDKIITDEQGIYTSGGAYSSLNLILYLVEKYAGREMSVLSSKIFEIDIDRNSQSPFIIFKGQKDHEDDTVRRAQEFIEQNFQERITVDYLAEKFALGRRNLERRFKRATGNTVVEYMQRVKVEAAKKSFENTRKNINEVMYDVGYTDTKAFRTIFKRITNLSPLEYKNKYNKEAALVYV